MDIKKYEIGKLNPAEYNPRKDLQQGDKEYEKIKKSIIEFGYIDPIIINFDGTIIGGHQRFKVLKELGYTEIDCVVVKLTKAQEKALNIALNKINGEWDFPLLKDLLLELDTGEIDLELTGYDMSEVESMMVSVNTEDFFESKLENDMVENKKDDDEIKCPYCGECV